MSDESTSAKKPRKPRRESRYLLVVVTKPTETDPLAVSETAVVGGIENRFPTPKAAWTHAEESNLIGEVYLLNIRDVRKCSVRQMFLKERVKL